MCWEWFFLKGSFFLLIIFIFIVVFGVKKAVFEDVKLGFEVVRIVECSKGFFLELGV